MLGKELGIEARGGVDGQRGRGVVGDTGVDHVAEAGEAPHTAAALVLQHLNLFKKKLVSFLPLRLSLSAFLRSCSVFEGFCMQNSFTITVKFPTKKSTVEQVRSRSISARCFWNKLPMICRGSLLQVARGSFAAAVIGGPGRKVLRSVGSSASE